VDIACIEIELLGLVSRSIEQEESMNVRISPLSVKPQEGIACDKEAIPAPARQAKSSWAIMTR
jgi:hypothetical protein